MSRVIYRWLRITIPILSQNKEHGSLNWAELQKELIVEGILLYSRSAQTSAEKHSTLDNNESAVPLCVFISNLIFSADEFTFWKTHTRKK